jgi:hypothetical protein
MFINGCIGMLHLIKYLQTTHLTNLSHSVKKYNSFKVQLEQIVAADGRCFELLVANQTWNPKDDQESNNYFDCKLAVPYVDNICSTHDSSNMYIDASSSVVWAS